MGRTGGVFIGVAGAAVLLGGLAVALRAGAPPDWPPAAAWQEPPVAVARAVSADPAPALRSTPALPPLPATAPAAAPPPAATLVLSVPPVLAVGEQAALDIEVAAHPSLHALALTLRFDPDRLQARSAEPGDGLPGSDSNASFRADVTESADQVVIVRTGAPRTGGRVARVQFQAVASGHSVVTISDASGSDVHGRVLPVSLAGARQAVLVEPLVR